MLVARRCIALGRSNRMLCHSAVCNTDADGGFDDHRVCCEDGVIAVCDVGSMWSALLVQSMGVTDCTQCSRAVVTDAAVFSSC